MLWHTKQLHAIIAKNVISGQIFLMHLGFCYGGARVERERGGRPGALSTAERVTDK
jgi:hypothetical protein